MVKPPLSSTSCRGSRDSSFMPLVIPAISAGYAWARSDVPEAVDRLEVLCPEVLCLGRNTQALLGGEAQHADLALVGVLVDVVRRLAGVLEAVGLRQRRVDLALGDE